jgi:hypothetical protein
LLTSGDGLADVPNAPITAVATLSIYISIVLPVNVVFAPDKYAVDP